MTNYTKGRSREYRIANKLRDEGMTVLRTAGSHGIVDLIALDPQTHIINFIQVKPKSMSKNAKNALQSKISSFEGNWQLKTCVVSLVGEMKR